MNRAVALISIAAAFAAVLADGRVDAELRRPGPEDEPAAVGVDEGPFEHVTEEGD